MYQNDENQPWSSGVYETGRTRPPKSHSGLVAVLLVAVVFLGGLVSALGIVNAQLFAKLNRHESAEPVSFVAETQPTEPSSTDEPAQQEPTLPTQTSPASVENIPQEDALSLQEIYARNIDSVVSITCRRSGGTGTGTGVILSTDGYIVTNCHVVEGAVAVTVLLTDGRELSAQIVGVDAASDLAVIRVDAGDLIPAVFGDDRVLRVGDAVAAIGDPLGVEFRGTFTNGIVSAINRDVTTGGRTMSLIQTNAALNSGNSGGPLINCYGQVIGINTLKIGTFTDSAGVDGLGFAIPSTTVQEIAGQLIGQGYVSGRPSMGISGEAVSLFYQRYYRMPAGLYLTEVAPGSAAARAGLTEGDILLSLDDTRITAADDVTSFLYGAHAGDSVAVIFYRAGAQYQTTLVLDEQKG